MSRQISAQKIADICKSSQSDVSELIKTKSTIAPPKRSWMGSRYFKMIFEDISDEANNRRQAESVLAQVGLEPDDEINEASLEEKIIIKALRDYNCSKFSREHLLNIEAIIKDVFITHQKEEIESKPGDYGQLGHLIAASFDSKKLDFNKGLETKAYQLFEITQVK